MVRIDDGSGGGGYVPPDTPPNAVTALAVVPDGDNLGATVSFQLTSLTGVGVVQILRAIGQNSVNIATVVTSALRTTAKQTYDDRNAAVVGKILYYFIRVWSVDGTYSDLYGSVKATLAPAAALPNDSVTWFDSSHDEYDGQSLKINIAAQIKDGVDFAALRVYIKDYRGNANQLPIAESDNPYLSFHVAKTDEVVTLYGVVINSAGVAQALGVALTSLIILSQAKTRPCRVAGIVVIEGQFTTEFRFNANTDKLVTGYRLYRAAAGAGFGAAAVVQTLIPTSEAVYAVSDNVKGLAYEWYLTAYNAAGESTPSVALQRSIAY